MKQFIKFCTVGLINTLIDIVAYYIFTRVFGIFYLIANILAFLASSTNSYFLNRFFTFQSNHHSKKIEYTKFMSVLVSGLILAEIILFTAVNIFHFNDLIGKGIAIAIVLFWNFFGSKILVFTIRKEK